MSAWDVALGTWLPRDQYDDVLYGRAKPMEVPGPPPHAPPAVKPEDHWRTRDSDMIHITDPARTKDGKRFTYCGLEVERVLPFRTVDCVVCKQMSNAARRK